jgi:hypothetical protein
LAHNLDQPCAIFVRSLQQLRATRSADGKTNLLRHLALLLSRKHGAGWVASFPDEFSAVGRGSRAVGTRHD